MFLTAVGLQHVLTGLAQVTEFDAWHVQMEVNGQRVLMQKEDGFLNATQIITLAK